MGRLRAYPRVEHLKRFWSYLKIFGKTRNACHGQSCPWKAFQSCPIFSGKFRSLPKSGAEKALALPEKLDKAIKPFRTCPIFPGKARSLSTWTIWAVKRFMRLAPGDVVVVRVEEPVPVPAHATKDAEGEEQENSWKKSWHSWIRTIITKSGANVITLFTAVIYRHSMVIPSFCVIKLYYNLGNYHGMAVNYHGIKLFYNIGQKSLL